MSICRLAVFYYLRPFYCYRKSCLATLSTLSRAPIVVGTHGRRGIVCDPHIFPRTAEGGERYSPNHFRLLCFDAVCGFSSPIRQTTVYTRQQTELLLPSTQLRETTFTRVNIDGPSLGNGGSRNRQVSKSETLSPGSGTEYQPRRSGTRCARRYHRGRDGAENRLHSSRRSCYLPPPGPPPSPSPTRQSRTLRKWANGPPLQQPNFPQDVSQGTVGGELQTITTAATGTNNDTNKLSLALVGAKTLEDERPATLRSKQVVQEALLGIGSQDTGWTSHPPAPPKPYRRGSRQATPTAPKTQNASVVTATSLSTNLVSLFAPGSPCGRGSAVVSREGEQTITCDARCARPVGWGPEVGYAGCEISGDRGPHLSTESSPFMFTDEQRQNKPLRSPLSVGPTVLSEDRGGGERCALVGSQSVSREGNSAEPRSQEILDRVSGLELAICRVKERAVTGLCSRRSSNTSGDGCGENVPGGEASSNKKDSHVGGFCFIAPPTVDVDERGETSR